MSFPVPLPSTFMPLPLAIMIPFMGIQSGVMAQQFGMNFQYGKRRISAMSNEEFNKLTPEIMQADMSAQIKNLIPTMKESLESMRPFQRDIFVEMLHVFKTAVDLGIDVGIAGADSIAHAAGTHIGHGATKQPDIDVHSFLSPIQQRVHIRHGHRQEIEQRYGTQPILTPTLTPIPTPTPIPAPKVVTLRKPVAFMTQNFNGKRKMFQGNMSRIELVTLRKSHINTSKKTGNATIKVIAKYNILQITNALRRFFPI